MGTQATALILAGGFGTRLGSLYPDTPKPLVPVAGQPFLHWLILWLRRQGFADFVFSVGYRGDQIDAWLRQTPVMQGASWQIYHEKTPLGTGGATRACLSLCRETLVVVNGDSLIVTPLEPMIETMEDRAIAGAILGKAVEDASRYGTLLSDADGFLHGFHEKRSGAGVISAGVTFLRRSVLEKFSPQIPLSMENDIMPQLIREGARIKLHEVPENTPFIDIGTPESVALVGSFIEKYLRPELRE